MNEVQLIRRQLGVERQHAAAVSRACASALAATDAQGTERLASLAAFRQASVEYLAWVLSRFEEREQLFQDLLRSRLGAEDPNRRAVENALALPGTSREALTKLESALGARAGTDIATLWTDFVRFFDGAWSARRDEIDRLFQQQAKIADWRTVSDIDADSIVDERSRFARVEATLPDGTELESSAPPR